MTAHPDAPTTLPEFMRRFPTKEACAELLFRVRWPDGFVCPKCGSTQGWPIAGRGVMECDAGHQTSVTAGTSLHRTKQPLTTWFYGAYLVSTLTPGISALQFQRQLGIKSYETAFNLLHKLRSALVAPDREPLKGEVEIDEAYVGGPEEGRPGRDAETKAMVVVAVEIVRWEEPGKDKDGNAIVVQRVRAGRTRMTVIPDGTAETLIPWVQAAVAPGSTVYTDGHTGYNALERLGYTHLRVLATHKRKKTGEYLPMVNLVISNLKRWLLGTHKGAVLPKHLQAYLNEFAFRFNRRFWRGPAFLRALGLMTHAERWPEYETLYTAGEQGGWDHAKAGRKLSRRKGARKASLAALLAQARPDGGGHEPG